MRKAILLCALLFIAIPVFGQGMRIDGQVLKPLAVGGVTSVSGARITVCTSAGTGTPCTPKVANIFSDEALTQVITGTGGAGTTDSDSNGNYFFYLQPGSYLYTITGSGITSATFKFVLPCGIATGCNHTVLESFAAGISAPTIGPSAGQQHTLPAVASDTVALLAAPQTLLAKTLTSSGSNNAVTLIDSQDPAGAITGNGTDQTFFTKTIPANTVQAGKGLRVRWALLNNNAVVLTIKLILGSTTYFTASTAGSANNVQGQVEIFNNAGVQNAQSVIDFAFDAATVLRNDANLTSAENFANALVLKLTVSEANPNTATPKKWIVELIQ